MEEKEKSNSLSTDERDRLKVIRPFRAACQLGSYYYNTRVVTINQSVLRGIQFGHCELSSNTPKVTFANGCASTQAQDRIIAINGKSTKGVAYHEAQRILNECKSNVVVIIGRLMATISDDKRKFVYMMRDKSQTTAESKAGIMVQEFCGATGIPKVTAVRQGGALSKCKVGDLILSINGIDVSGDPSKLLELLKEDGRKEFEILKAVPM